MKQIPLFKTKMHKNDLSSIKLVLERETFWAIGSEIEDFENRLSNYLGVKHCLVFNSGTSAGHVLMESLNIKNKEVIIPSFSFIATANVVKMAGGLPVFADIEEETLGISPTSVEGLINSNTRVIMPMHYGGSSCNITQLKDICRKNSIFLIEDNAESLGCEKGGKMLGSFGSASWLSFASNKIISTGEGGAIATNDLEIYEKCKLIRSHGREEKSNYFNSSDFFDYIDLGYNFRMPSMNAALGISQLDNIESNISKRRKIASKYNNFFSESNYFDLIPSLSQPESVYQLYSILTRDSNFRSSLISYLGKNNISSKVYFSPIHETTFYRKKLKYKDDLPITSEISNRILSLPIYPDLSDEDIERVISVIQTFVNNYES